MLQRECDCWRVCVRVCEHATVECVHQLCMSAMMRAEWNADSEAHRSAQPQLNPLRSTLRILGVKSTEQFFLLLHPLWRGLHAYSLFAFVLLLSFFHASSLKELLVQRQSGRAARWTPRTCCHNGFRAADAVFFTVVGLRS